jgi:hypothetical protein
MIISRNYRIAAPERQFNTATIPLHDDEAPLSINFYFQSIAYDYTRFNPARGFVRWLRHALMAPVSRKVPQTIAQPDWGGLTFASHCAARPGDTRH